MELSTNPSIRQQVVHSSMSSDEALNIKVLDACHVIWTRTQNPTGEDHNRETAALCRSISILRTVALSSGSLPSTLRDQIILSLRSLLASVTNQVLSPASYLLGDMKAFEAVPELLELLKPDAEKVLKIDFWADPFGDHEQSVQEIGCNALVRMNAVDAIPEIEKLLSNPDEGIRECATQALRVLRS